MILKKKQVIELRQALEAAKQPLFYYDSDPDGLCSFLLFYRHNNEGRGILVKGTSYLGKNWAKKVEEVKPDATFILDIPNVEQQFIDNVKTPLYWVDHHTPVDRNNVKYYNPRVHEKHAYIPTTRVAYEIVQDDLWIAMVGCVADWHLPDFKDEFINLYPDLLSHEVNDPETALFETPVGRLARIFAFLLKGKNSDVYKCVKILTRITDPHEILDGTTSQGKFILKRFEKINKMYQELLGTAKKKKTRSKFLIFKYTEDQWSFSSELSNELSHLFKDKVILVCREKDGKYKCSIRSRQKPIADVLQKALHGIEGRGGGHEYACGAVISSQDFDQFIKNMKREYK